MRVLTLLLFVLCVGCASVPESGWRSAISRSLLQPLDPSPEVSTRILGETLVITIRNNSEGPLCYSALQEGVPSILVEQFVDGKWSDKEWDWCGTGKRTFEISPGGVLQTRVARSSLPERSRIYLVLTRPSAGQSSLVLLFQDGEGAEPGATDNPGHAHLNLRGLLKSARTQPGV
jgi:hypothetical protein